MMTTSASLSLYLLLISNAVLVAAASIAVLRFQRFMQTSQQSCNCPTEPPQREKQQNDTYAERANSRTNTELLQCIASLQSLVILLADKNHMQQVPVTSDLPIENAARMARHGASVAAITRSCGLNIGEAQLMKRMHARVLTPGASA